MHVSIIVQYKQHVTHHTKTMLLTPPPPKKKTLCRKPKYEFIFVIMYMLNHHRQVSLSPL